MPIGKIAVEVANFDIQKIKNPEIKGAEYQQGVQSDFWSVREYVLYRDNHKCRYCKGKSKDMVLNVHHLESRKTGGNSPDNLITLCETCHNMYHRGLISLDNVTKGSSYKPETFMSILRKYLIENLRKIYNNASYTYGYETKSKRIANRLEKDLNVDPAAFPEISRQSRTEYIYIKKVLGLKSSF